MLHNKLVQLLNISYYHMLIYGLMPTTLRNSKSSRLRICKVSYVYLIYSFCITVCLFLQFRYMFPPDFFEGYMKNNIILQWNMVVNAGLRVLVIVSCYSLVWLRRQRLVRLYLEFLLYWRMHWPILRRIVGDQTLDNMQLQLANIFLRQIYVNYTMLCCSIVIQYKLLGGKNILQMLVKTFQMLMLTAIRLGFSSLLLLITHQFESVQLALLAIRQRVGSRSLEDLRRIANIHTKWLQLARNAFDIYDLNMATVFVIMFAVNVNILYHAVQYGQDINKSDLGGIIIGDVLIVTNLWNTALVMNLIEHTSNSCNNAGQILRQFTDDRRLSTESQLELDLLMNRIRNNKLVFRICGCVDMDRAAFLSYMSSVLNKVIILMQFDLNRKQELSLQHVNNKT
ncbi:putative gustatory receptor 58b [Drosophila sulfurigaster albostrigata]|uniref:putative gustatory receptor 58b n=1 Tax=Drosophila sulfurigaster albostrigata TaxID=89887 RepID=UPI002D2198FA|nr:putative gustatory receptor 58b [Drosophila sulfurigaster albostrigata]